MQISIQIDPSVADDLSSPEPSQAASQAIMGLVSQHHGKIQSTFRNAVDSDLKSHFYIELGDSVDADSLVSSLAQAKGVEAVYVKPEDGPPG